MDKFKLMDKIGTALFRKLFTNVEEIIVPTDIYSKYDLEVTDKGKTKYIEIKCLKEIFTYSMSTLITVEDFEYLTGDADEDTKSLYVLFTDKRTVVYDLNKTKELGLYSIQDRGNYQSEMNQNNYRNKPYVILDLEQSIKQGTANIIKKGSKDILNISIYNTLSKLKKNTLTPEEYEHLMKKSNGN